jgi:hypothetical protein
MIVVCIRMASAALAVQDARKINFPRRAEKRGEEGSVMEITTEGLKPLACEIVGNEAKATFDCEELRCYLDGTSDTVLWVEDAEGKSCAMRVEFLRETLNKKSDTGEWIEIIEVDPSRVFKPHRCVEVTDESELISLAGLQQGPHENR